MSKESEQSKLWDLLEVYGKIVHPDLFNKLKEQMSLAFEENRQRAYAGANISDDALWLEKRLKDLQGNLKRLEEMPDLKRFHLKCFYKSLLEKFINEQS